MQRAEWAANVGDVRRKDTNRRRRWRRENPEKLRDQKRRERYAVDSATFAALLAAQKHRCAICGEPDPNCIDHCHQSLRVRGVLCRKCNAGLGQFCDDPSRLAAAILYLRTAAKNELAKAPAHVVPLRRRHPRE